MSTLTAERPTAELATRAKAPKRRRLRGEAKLHPMVWVFVVAVMGFSLIPFYWLVNTSLKKGASLSQGELFPSQPTLENYLVVFQNPEFLLALRNSVIIAVVTTTVALVFVVTPLGTPESDAPDGTSAPISKPFGPVPRHGEPVCKARLLRILAAVIGPTRFTNNGSLEIFPVPGQFVP